jgi:hypothetical protein
MCTPVIPAVPYLLLGLQGVQWAVENSHGARKLARTPHVNKKKIYIWLTDPTIVESTWVLKTYPNYLIIITII